MTSRSHPGFPAGLVAFLDAGLGDVPAGWEAYQPAQGRLLLAVTDRNQVGQSWGQPVGKDEAPMHTHAVTGNVDVPVYHTSTVGGSNQNLGASGSHAATGSLAPASLGLGFMHLVPVRSLGRGDPAASDSLPYGALAFFDRPPPPSWTVREALEGRFLLASDTGSVTLNDPWDPAAPPGHTHTVAGSFELDGNWFTWGGGANSGSADHATATLSGSASAPAEPVVPYLGLLLCEKTELPGPGSPPRGLAMYFGTAQPPDGWRRVLGCDDRFVVGLPSGGEPGFTSGNAVGATGTHSHTGTAIVTVPSFDTDLGSGIENLELGRSGDYGMSCSSDAVQVSLPVVTASLCFYAGN
jgi:hypothetical protein